MSTRLLLLFRNRNHSSLYRRVAFDTHSYTISRLSRAAAAVLPRAGAGANAASGRMATTSRRDLGRELQEGIQEWTGPSVFTSSSTVSGVVASPSPTASSSSSSSSENGSKDRPITVDSTPPLPRGVRGVVRYESPLPRTAYTPPRPRPEPTSTKTTTVHPFFTTGPRSQPHRAKSVPAPAAHRPRLVAHYSSTDDTSQSQSQSQSSQSTFGQPSQPKPKGPSGISAKGGHGKGKGKERAAEGPPAGWSDAAVDRIADDLAGVRISRERKPIQIRSTVSAPVPAPALAQAASSTSTPVTSAKRSTPNDRPYFHHGSLAHPPKVAYTTDLSEADDLVACLRGDVLGFDLEWPPAGKYQTRDHKTGRTTTHWVGRTWNQATGRYTFTPGQTALVQVCDRDLVILVHLKNTKDLPGAIVDLVQDTSKYKLGVQIAGDGRKLLGDFPKQLKRACSLLELSRLARRVDGEAIGPGNTLISLAKLSERYLGQALRKDAGVRTGDWSRSLSQEQINYAANDVYASYLIYNRLRALAEERGIPLDLPGYCSNMGDIPRTAPTATGRTALAGQGNGRGLAPTPAQARTIEMFVSGQTTLEISTTMGVQQSTVQNYLAAGLARAHEDVLNDDEKRRFLNDVRGVYWVERKHLAVINKIKAELQGGDPGRPGAQDGTTSS